MREQPILFVDGNDLSFDRRKVLSQQAAHARAIKTASPKEVQHGGHVHIVLSFNDRYLKPACATINSILTHTANKNDITFYVLHDEGLSQSTINRIEDTYEGDAHFCFVRVGESFVNRFPLNRKEINVNTYYRLLLQNTMPSCVERIIYLDTDIIVCDDIVDLWNFHLDNHLMAGARDESGAVCSWRLFGSHMNETYVNAGVLLLDLKKAREKYGNLDFLYARSFYENDVNITMQDQDILNIAYKDDIALLPLSWNVPSSAYYRKSAHSDGDYEGRENFFSDKERQEAVNHPKIIHFTGKQKPWKFNSMHPLKALFWSYLRKTSRLSWREYILSLNNAITIKKGAVILRQNRDFRTLFSIENLKRSS
nr:MULTISPECIES: glycosyltransferase family 8 protein [unclassified Saccharibacter]